VRRSALPIDALHTLGLTVWAAALISAAVAALNVFPVLRNMPITMGAYPGVPATEHWRFAAGEIMEGVFFTADLMQFVAVPMVIITLFMQMSRARAAHRIRGRIRAGALIIAAMLFTLHATTIAPPMNRLLRAQWAAAAQGDTARIEAYRRDFHRLHVRADGILRVNLVLVLIGIALLPSALLVTGSQEKDGERVSAGPRSRTTDRSEG